MVPKRFFMVSFVASWAVALLGAATIPLMDIDASQYASIAREMLQRNSYLQVFDLGKDYLDKPPLLFWLSALSMKFLGVHQLAYRLPSLLVLLLGQWSCYRLAHHFYGPALARTAVLVLASCQAFFLITHDVRTDTLLMGWVMATIWFLVAGIERNHSLSFLAAFTCLAMGLMTKGPIALVVPVLALAPHYVLRRQWGAFFKWQYLAGLAWVGLLLLPMCWGLYQQYDLHPGKIIAGQRIDSGLRFYFWTQSFGRYTGENVYHEMGYFGFLFENMLWSFLPWVLFFLLGLYLAFQQVVKSKFRLSSTAEWISASGFVLTYLVLSRSQAQLPHYIFVVYPLAAILVAQALAWAQTKNHRFVQTFQGFHGVLALLLWFFVGAILYFPFPDLSRGWLVFPCLAIVVLCGAALRRKWTTANIVMVLVCTAIGVNTLLSGLFYPRLLQFQMGNDAAQYLKAHPSTLQRTYRYGIANSNALHFYAQHVFPLLDSAQQIKGSEVLLVPADSLPPLQKRFPFSRVLHRGPHYPVSLLTAEFLSPKTRPQHTPHYLVLDLSPKP